MLSSEAKLLIAHSEHALVRKMLQRSLWSHHVPIRFGEAPIRDRAECNFFKAVTYLEKTGANWHVMSSTVTCRRQQHCRACDPALRHRKEELVVHRYAQWRNGASSTLQFGRDS